MRTNKILKVTSGFLLLIFIQGFLGSSSVLQEESIRPSIVPDTLLPEKIMELLIQEVSGEIQMKNEKLLSSFNRNRTAEEYQKIYFESQCLLDKLKEYEIDEYGIEEVPIFFVSRLVWDAESAELWMLEPEKKKLTCLEDVPACLCTESQTCDVTAELVYVGPGTSERYYEDKDVQGKLVLVTERPYKAHDFAVRKYGAEGLVVCNSVHPEYDLDQVGWDTISRYSDPAENMDNLPTFGFMISARMGNELRRMLEKGTRVVLQAKCKTRYYPRRNELVWARIKGREKPEEELVMTAHVFEGIAKQGANDNISGSVSLLETARVIQKLIRENKIERPRRSIRFLWVEEHVGTLGYIEKHPELVKGMFANINEDMVGEALLKNRSSFHLMTTPYSLPSFLNDVLANFIEFVGETNRDNIIHRPVEFVRPILSATGSRDPFFYHIEKFYGGSDHDIFVGSGIGIPGVCLIAWPDMWYHTNLDRPDKSDSTQLKRVSVIDTAAVLFLTEASVKEAYQLIGEVLSRGVTRIGEEERRAYALLNKAPADDLPSQYKEAKNLIHQAFEREKYTLKTVLFFADKNEGFKTYNREICQNLTAMEKVSVDNLRSQYVNLAVLHGVDPAEPGITSEELRLSRLIPHKTEKARGYFNRREFYESLKGKNLPEYNLRRYEDFEISNFIDGRRSILEIRNAVSAEFRPIPLIDVENYIKVLEIGGRVTIEKSKR